MNNVTLVKSNDIDIISFREKRHKLNSYNDFNEILSFVNSNNYTKIGNPILIYHHNNIELAIPVLKKTDITKVFKGHLCALIVSNNTNLNNDYIKIKRWIIENKYIAGRIYEEHNQNKIKIFIQIKRFKSFLNHI